MRARRGRGELDEDTGGPLGVKKAYETGEPGARRFVDQRKPRAAGGHRKFSFGGERQQLRDVGCRSCEDNDFRSFGGVPFIAAVCR